MNCSISLLSKRRGRKSRRLRWKRSMTPLTTRMMAARTDYAARPGQNADRLVPVHRTLPAIVPVRETAPTRNPHSLSPEAPRVVHVRLSYACRRPKPFDLAAVPHCNWECPRMPKTVTPKASLAPRYHFRRVGSQVVSNGFYFFPGHWSGGAISLRNGKHVYAETYNFHHEYAWTYFRLSPSRYLICSST